MNRIKTLPIFWDNIDLDAESAKIDNIDSKIAAALPIGKNANSGSMSQSDIDALFNTSKLSAEVKRANKAQKSNDADIAKVNPGELKLSPEELDSIRKKRARQIKIHDKFKLKPSERIDLTDSEIEKLKQRRREQRDEYLNVDSSNLEPEEVDYILGKRSRIAKRNLSIRTRDRRVDAVKFADDLFKNDILSAIGMFMARQFPDGNIKWIWNSDTQEIDITNGRLNFSGKNSITRINTKLQQLAERIDNRTEKEKLMSGLRDRRRYCIF